MPGAGKSTLGKKLARVLGKDFIDLDDVIEEQMNMSISTIFSELGESQFRVAEKRALSSLLNEKNHVIAVGGGTPCFFNNMEKMNESGITIFLDPALDVLKERLRSDYKDRPKLANSPSLSEVLIKTYEERQSDYIKAQFRLDIPHPTVEDILALLESESDR